VPKFIQLVPACPESRGFIGIYSKTYFYATTSVRPNLK